MEAATRARSPTELLAASLATCTAITIEMYADRKEWDLGTVEVVADFTKAHPRRSRRWSR